jgi:DNA (cytosine-5)-methyltransferase 1
MDAVLSLFSGAGGMSLGFEQASIKPSFAADINEAACLTYSQNLNLEACNIDLGRLSASQMFDHFSSFRDCLAVIGGPPCQGFSSAGLRQSDDPRNRLVAKYLKIVNYVRPRWFLFENVEGLLTSENGKSVNDVVKILIENGYTVRVEKINFAAWGLPQSRKRVIIMGNRLGLDFELPPQTHSYTAGKHRSVGSYKPAPTFMDATSDLPPAANSDSALTFGSRHMSSYAEQLRGDLDSVWHHVAIPTGADSERYALLKQGQTMKDLPMSAWHPSYGARANRRVSDGMPTEKRGGAPAGLRRLIETDCAPTITSAACREFVHPLENRPLTLREAARLQGFPDKFRFSGGMTATALQIGNAVPPPAAKTLALDMLKADGRAGSGLGFSSVGSGLLGYRLTEANGKSPALQKTELALAALQRAGTHRTYSYA